MKKLSHIFAFFVPILCYGQINESFSDGNFTENPAWTGTASSFTVNASLQLQSNASTTSTSYLFTPSEAIDNATWDCWVKIAYNPSSSNYASVYLVSDRADVYAGCKGYYVQIGGTNDEVSLFLQEGTKKTKIIDGIDKRTDRNPVEIRIRVTRDANGKFSLFSKLNSELDFTQEGEVQNTVVKQSNFFGVLFANTSSTGMDYYFDDIVVTGQKAVDNEAPLWTSFTLIQPNSLNLQFSEAMDYSRARFEVDQGIGEPVTQHISENSTEISLTFENDFEKGKIYELTTSGLSDLAGNALERTKQSIGITESVELGDLILNEIMFENPANSVEYIEIYNRSQKLLNLSGVIFTTRKTDGSLNTGNSIPSETILLPASYLALCENTDSLRTYFHLTDTNNIRTIKWSALNNENATLIVCNSAKDTIFEELTYSSKWHHPLIKNPKGVALERIHPDLPTQDAYSWHSAASEVNYGTPGYQNSQFRELNSSSENAKTVWADPEAFSPDNDGVDDICMIRYKTEAAGFVANILILNAVGVPVYKIASNVLLQADGFFSWDGKTDEGKLVNAGIYVLYFEMINPSKGQKTNQKRPIVVSYR